MRSSRESYVDLRDPCWDRLWGVALSSHSPELPAIPKDMRFCDYAELCFGEHCKHCLQPSSRLARLFIFRTRLCPRCYRNHIISERTVMKEILRKNEWFLVSILPSIFASGIDGDTHDIRCYYRSIVVKRIEQYRNLSDSEARRGWVKALKAQTALAIETDKALSNWIIQEESKYRAVVATPKIGRGGEQILDFLKTKPENWTEDDFPKSHKLWQNYLSIDRQLSDEELESAYIDLGYLLTMQREWLSYEKELPHLLRQRENLFIERFENLRQQATCDEIVLYPRASMIFKVKIIEIFMRIAGSDVSRAWSLCLPHLKQASSFVTQVAVEEIGAWYSKCRAMSPGIGSIRGQCNTAGSTHADTPEIVDMSHPASVFTCSACDYPLWTQNMHLHEHFINSYPWSDVLERREAVVVPVSNSSRPRLIPDGPSTLRYNEKLVRLVSELTKSSDSCAGATIKELLAMGDRYICDQCSIGDQKPVSFDKLVFHFHAIETAQESPIEHAQESLACASHSSHSKYVLLSEEDANDQHASYVRRLENMVSDGIIVSYSKYWDDNLQCKFKGCTAQAKVIDDVRLHPTS
ncbi:hypothetical protein FRC03_011432 [Tulasnella sp. 419]|nr:hypothetical protein FRC03_011432 [Tulasnella sp. 419]